MPNCCRTCDEATLGHDIAVAGSETRGRGRKEGGGDFGDGTKIKTHRTRKMCFPAIAAGPTRMELFRQYYGVGDIDFDDLEFEKACRSDAVKGVLGALGEDWSKNIITTARRQAIFHTIKNRFIRKHDGIHDHSVFTAGSTLARRFQFSKPRNRETTWSSLEGRRKEMDCNG